jgi:hypothetical protein
MCRSSCSGACLTNIIGSVVMRPRRLQTACQLPQPSLLPPLVSVTAAAACCCCCHCRCWRRLLLLLLLFLLLLQHERRTTRLKFSALKQHSHVANLLSSCHSEYTPSAHSLRANLRKLLAENVCMFQTYCCSLCTTRHVQGANQTNYQPMDLCR